MEVTLLLEVVNRNQLVLYSPVTKKEMTVTITNEQADYYESLLNENEENVFVIYNEDTNQLSYIEDEKELG